MQRTLFALAGALALFSTMPIQAAVTNNTTNLMMLAKHSYHGGYYVCYNSRSIKSKSYGTWVKYHGCHRSFKPCYYRNKLGFGRYATRYQQLNGYKRCKANRPIYHYR